MDATIADKSIYLTKGKVLKGLYTGRIGNTSAQCDIVDFKEDGSFSAMFIYKVGMIDDEDVWLEALAERNNVANAYNRDIALDIVRKTKEKFYSMFEKLLVRLEEV